MSPIELQALARYAVVAILLYCAFGLGYCLAGVAEQVIASIKKR